MAIKVLAASLALLALMAWTDGESSDCKKGLVCRNTFTYLVRNQHIPPYFSHSMTLKLKSNNPVIYYMEQACLDNPLVFKSFTSTFYAKYGFFIESINGLAGNWKDNKTYWELWNTTKSLNVGVSYYVPSPGDRVMLDFTVGPGKQKPRHIPLTNGRR